MLDRPVSGRIFFEDVIRENLDIGRPKQVPLIFDRWVTKTTPGRFRTRVITDGVIPSLHIDYKGTRIKQYHKEGQALMGFSNRDLRSNLATLRGQPIDQFTQGRMTYQLRRLRLHGLIEQIPKTHRYRLTSFGFRVCRLLHPHLREDLALRPGLGTSGHVHLSMPFTTQFR